MDDDGPGLEPEGLEEVLGVAVAGRATRADPDAAAPAPHQASSRSIMASPTPTALASSVTNSSSMTASGRPSARARPGRCRSPITASSMHHDHHVLIRIGQGPAARLARSGVPARPRVSDHSMPPRSAASWCVDRPRWPATRDRRDRRRWRPPGALHHADLSWAILFRMVLRPRLVASYRRTASSSSPERPPRRGTTCEADRLS